MDTTQGRVGATVLSERDISEGFDRLIAANRAFFIPKAFGSSIRLTGGPESALYGSLAFYVTCIVVTWWFYSRRNAKIPC